MTASDHPVVLVVEDDRNLADLYSEWLSAAYAVRTAYDGEQAQELLDEAVDVVLLDRRMPGLSGDDVLDQLREQGLDCRVAMVTAVDPDFDIIGMGFDEYINKPIGREELNETVEELLERAGYDDEIQEYFSLISKKAALQAEKSEEALADNGEYLALVERLDELDERLDTIVEGMDGAESSALDAYFS